MVLGQIDFDAFLQAPKGLSPSRDVGKLDSPFDANVLGESV
jgi:hypothetical protein